MAYRSHKDLLVWQKSIALTKRIYDITKKFPQEETYGLSSQMQRAAVSIPSNIAEGHGRGSNLEFDRFLRIANGSACELETQIEIAALNFFITKEEKDSLQEDLVEIMRLIYSLRKYFQTNPLSHRH